jgi:hypothetical protein
MKWAYGVTTVPERLTTTLPNTLASLAQAGFPAPVLYVDGPGLTEAMTAYDVVVRPQRRRTVGNWVLGMWELYLRDPQADRYAMFQDDLLAVANLRQYLEGCKYPRNGYLNLYTFPENEKDAVGWHPSNQLGKGAVGLVFSNDALRVLLSSQHLVDKPTDPVKGHRNLDGCIVSAMSKAGWKEYVHMPSLLQHADDGVSSMGNRRHEQASSFPGEATDARSFARETVAPRRKDPKRIGLVGYHCRNVYGEINRQLARYLDLDSWMILPHPEYPTLPFPPEVDCQICYTGRKDKVDSFVRMVDILVFFGNPHYPTLMEAAKKYNRRTVCIAMVDEPDAESQWAKDVNLFIAPTKDIYARIKDSLPTKGFEWPWDIEEHPYVGWLGQTMDMDSDARHSAELNRWSLRCIEARSLIIDGTQCFAIPPELFNAKPQNAQGPA